MKRNAILLKSILTCLFLIFSFNLSAASKYGFEKKDTTIYFNSLEEKETVHLYYSKATGKIPYVDLREMLCSIANPDYCTGKAEGNVYTLTRKNGSTAQIDTKTKIIHFDDYDLFNKLDSAVTLLDIVTDCPYIQHQPASFEMRGESLDIEYGTFLIDVFIEENRCLMPLQTFIDIFAVPSMAAILFNGEELFYVNSEYELKDSDGYTELGEQFYKVETGLIDKDFASYNHRELALNMQLHYGLRVQHDIVKFSDWFEMLGLDKQLSSTNTTESDNAVLNMCLKYLGDIHSFYALLSPYTDREATITVDVINPSLYNFQKLIYETEEIRDQFFPKGIPGYQKIGDTAYVTFDSFWMDSDRNYYEEPLTAEEWNKISTDYPSSDVDTIGLINYANMHILTDPKIRNVVIDLSCNTGGSFNAAVFTACWLLGTPTITIKNGITGCQSSTAYAADVDFDGKYDPEFDCLSNKRIFVLVSGITFSCANLLTSILADSGKATVIGSKTGGGSCAVYITSTATGSLFKTSSQWLFSSQKNGVVSNIDTGISPDYKLTETKSFYNRSQKGLTGFINRLY